VDVHNHKAMEQMFVCPFSMQHVMYSLLRYNIPWYT